MRGSVADSCNNGVKEEEEEEEESLSLCDLPINGENQSRKESPIPKPAIESQEEFNFCETLISEESEMCVADEVFSQGQILPLRHSVSCDSGFTRLQSDIRNASRCISRSDSMDHCYSGGLTSASSRSSSINSHHSSSSGSSTGTTTIIPTSEHSKPRPHRVRNHFQYSHPSPKPQIRPSNIKNGINSANSNRNSGLWSLFRVGLMTPPEIAIQDLKNRSNSNKNSTQSSGSRNSTSSNISISSNSNKTNSGQRKPPFFFNKNGVLFGGCKCMASSVGPNPSRIAVDRSSTGGSAKEAANAHEEKQHAMKMTKHQEAGKQALSRHRTFEWLKQLSLEAAMDQT